MDSRAISMVDDYKDRSDTLKKQQMNVVVRIVDST